MAESNFSSKKRKQHSYPTHNPLAGIFTRSKSQIYLHCNRSGRARADSTRFDHYSTSKKPKNILDSSDVDDLSCTPVKDLRTRRVFSDCCGFRGANDEGNTKERSASGFAFKSCFVSGGDCIGDAKVRDDEDDMEKFDSGFCCQVAGCLNPTLIGIGLSIEESRGDVKAGENEDDKINKNRTLVMEKARNNGESDISNGVGNSNEECVRTTPPDIEFLPDKQSNGSNQKNHGCIGEARNDNAGNGNGTNSRTKPVFSRSRLKLFKTPGSLSYRRLLPFLTDIAKDNYCSLKTVQSSKIEKVLEEKKISSSHSQEVLLNEPEKESCPGKSNAVDSSSMLNSRSKDCITESSVLFDSQKEVCMGRDFSPAPFSLVEEWSKPILDGGIEEFMIKISGKDQNLKNSSHDLCLNEDKSIGTNSVCVVPSENGESETSYSRDCDPQNMKTLNCSSSSIMDNSDSNNDNVISQSSDDTKQCTTEGLDKSDAGHSPVGKNLHLMNSNLAGEEQNGILSSSWGSDNNDEILDHANNSNEECVQMTPPDADIFVQPKMLENHGSPRKHALHSVDHVLGEPLDGNSNKFLSSNDKSINSNPRRNLVLKPCSRPKLLKSPGSVNYRRMLPFLRDYSCVSRKCDCLKLQKNLGANLLSPSPVSVCQEMPTGNSNGNCHYAQCHDDNSSAMPITIPVASSIDQEKVLSSYQHVNESPGPLNSQQKWEVYFEQNISETDKKLESDPANMEVVHENRPLVTPLNSLLSSGSLPREDAKLVSHASYVDICKNSVIEVSNGAKQIEQEKQHLSQPGASFHLDMPVTVHKKGILKRTPRGCRGPCTCLNCSSFRLHAERAFEFSRYQMQDAEEVAFDLIRELSYMRNLLEKSTFGADGYAGVCVNQLKEACKRASKAEVLAQNRLGQMNFDLDIHCRVTCDQRPRVRFANYVEETFMGESALPSSGLTRREGFRKRELPRD